MTPPEPGSSLAAMVTALAEVTAAQAEGLSWNQIAAQYGYPTGRQAKKDVHALRGHVTRQLRLAQNRERPHGGPYVHEFTGPSPEEPYEDYVPYTMTGPGVVPAED